MAEQKNQKDQNQETSMSKRVEHFIGNASNLRVGDVGRYHPAPGSQRFEPVEVVKTRRLPVGNISGRDVEVT